VNRLFALLAAVAMVAGAFLLRGWLDDRDDSNGNGDGNGEQSSDEQMQLLCDPSLTRYCRDLEEANDDLTVEIVDSAAASDRFGDPAFSSRDDEVDGWLVPSPFPAMVDEARGRAGQRPVFDEVEGSYGRSPLVIAMWIERADALAPDCAGGVVAWRCIGDDAGQLWADIGGSAAWGRLKPGFERPTSSATGLLVVGQASADYFETPDFASNDFATGGFRGWLRNLVDSVPGFPSTAGTPLDQMLAAGPASYDLVGTTEAEAVLKVESSRDNERLVIIYPSAMATADLQFAPVRGAAGADRLSELLDDGDSREDLAALGWRVPDEDLAPGLPGDLELPDGNGLPRPGVLQALRNEL
jgi:hypothetical protein